MSVDFTTTYEVVSTYSNGRVRVDPSFQKAKAVNTINRLTLRSPIPPMLVVLRKRDSMDITLNMMIVYRNGRFIR